MWLAHAGETHQGEASAWWHALTLDNYVLAGGLIAWILFLAAWTLWGCRQRGNLYAALAFGLVNIAGIFFFDGAETQNRITAFVFFNAGVVLLAYCCFKAGRRHWKTSLSRGENRGDKRRERNDR